MVREEELIQKAKEVREALIAMAADEIDATHIEVGQIKAKDDVRKLLTVRVGGANRYVPYAGHDTSEFTVGDYWAIIFDDYGTIRLGWWTSNNAGAGTIPFRNHDLLDGDAHPDTVAQAVTRGSVIIGDSTPEWNELPIGAAGRILTSDGVDVSWAAPGAGVAAHNILDGNVHLDSVADAVTRGSIIVGNSTPKWDELPIGAAGRVLTVVAGDAAWAVPAAAGLYSDYIHIRDEKATTVNGGGFTMGAWRTRDLTVELSDTGGDAALAANQITLEAGTYRVLISCPAFQVGAHKTRLQNITDGVTILVGTPEFNWVGDSVANRSFVKGRFTLASQKVLEVQHQCAVTNAVHGFGVNAGFGVIEVYTELELWKEA